jgi:hypothetical protein
MSRAPGTTDRGDRVSPRPSRADEGDDHVQEQLIPHDVAEALAAFVDRQAHSSLPLFGDADADAHARAGWVSFVQQYRRAVRDRRELTADNLAHVLLDIASLFRHGDGFDTRWLTWVPPEVP